MNEGKKYYYDVELSLSAIWKNNTYSYYSATELEKGAIVEAPFGKATKIGFISSSIEKPEYDTKELKSVNPLVSVNPESFKFYNWLKDYYPNTPGNLVQHMLPTFVKAIKNPKSKVATSIGVPNKPPDLTEDQKAVIKDIEANDKPHVLHGITGSGKTRVFCELARQALEKNKNVLILYPEISLTSQLYSVLSEFFGSNKIHALHSKMTITEKRNTWLNCLNFTSGSITIGPRSALFLPHQNLGLIVIDESHDSAYKQDSGARYNGVVVAGGLSQVHNAKLLIASATPPVAETQQILKKGGSLSCLHDLAISNDSKNSRNFEIIDMREKSNHSTSSYLLSKSLLKSIESSLSSKKQSLLFLNRRGTAKVLLCENCGWHAECNRCDSPMTFHHDNFELRCHICGNRESTPKMCPKCSRSLSQKSPGTKALEMELKSIFPNAKVMRFDSDNKKSESFVEHFTEIAKGKVDIIIGTQLLTKGLDLPLLETLGILQADSSLYLPDYVSEEKSFQQLTQVSGRVGRGHIDGRVILQTYNPENKLFDYVLSQDWHGFYDDELLKREKSNYPPFAYLLKVWVSKPNETLAISSITKLSAKLLQEKTIKILGPAPSFYGKVGGNYSWQLIVKSNSRTKLVEIAKKLPKDFLFDLDPVSLL